MVWMFILIALLVFIFTKFADETDLLDLILTFICFACIFNIG
jgi:hypothetical protein